MNIISRSSLLSLLRNNCKTLSHLNQLIAVVSKSGFDADPLIVGQLLLLPSTALPSSLSHALRFFSFLRFPPDTFIFNALIRAHSLSSTSLNSFNLYSIMLLCDSYVFPDSFSFAFLLKAAANSRDFFAGVQVHAQSFIRGFTPTHIFVATTLVSFYGECCCRAAALQAFEEITEPNVVAWNAAVTACFRSDDIDYAQELFDQMPVRNITSWNLLLAGYSKGGEMDKAQALFSSMLKKDSVSWSTMIVGYASNGYFGEAFRLFRESLRDQLVPNEVSLTGIFSACGQSGAYESGRALHAHVEKAGFDGIVAVSNALLDMYARCGNIAMAKHVFDWEINNKTLVSWTTMIAALAMHGHGQEVIKLFTKMEEQGIEPDAITFISVLYACSHAGLIDTGQECFNWMKEKYCIEPTIEHYGCMVDLYGRAGLLEKAYEFVNQMPLQPNSIIWRILLGACSIHGNVSLAELVRSKLSNLDPCDSGDFILLSNIYAVARKWKDVTDVRQIMTEGSLMKSPGWSSIEVDKVIYGFVANDDKSVVREEAHQKLDEIMSRLRTEGYIPDLVSVLHDIEEEEKHDAVLRHSEKLAVAFGIARLSQEKVIRIMKNLRVCRDCHTVMKLISKVYRREIVLRDRSRFHCFKEGSCSCMDYW